MKILLIDANFATESPDLPLGIGCVAASLKQKQIPYYLYDQSVRRYSVPYLLRCIREYEPDIVGFSCYTWTIEPSCLIAEKLKQLRPDCLIVFGGPFVTGDPERIFSRCDAVDVIVRGDGEETFLELVRNPRIQDYPHIPGLSYRREGQIHHTPDRALVEDLDLYPSPFLEGVFDLSRYSRIGLSYSRGCTQKCAFCAWGTAAGGGRFRRMSLDRFLAELECVYANGPKVIIPHDGTFNSSDQFIFQLCDEILKREIRFRWEDVDMRADLVRRDHLVALRSIGVVQVGFGYESVHPRTQKLIRKNLDVETLLPAIATARELGFSTHCGFIVGLPGETRQDVLATAEFAKKINPHQVGVFPLELLPGTELYNNHTRYGIRRIEAPWRGRFGLECETNLMSRQEKWSLVRQLSAEFNEFNTVVWSGILRGMRRWAIAYS